MKLRVSCDKTASDPLTTSLVYCREPDLMLWTCIHALTYHFIYLQNTYTTGILPTHSLTLRSLIKDARIACTLHHKALLNDGLTKEMWAPGPRACWAMRQWCPNPPLSNLSDWAWWLLPSISEKDYSHFSEASLDFMACWFQSCLLCTDKWIKMTKGPIFHMVLMQMEFLNMMLCMANQCIKYQDIKNREMQK